MTVQPEVYSSLEANRVQELEYLLTEVTKKITQYVAEADIVGASIGPKIAPKELAAKLKLSLPEKGTKESGLLAIVDQILEYSPVTWHPGFMDKLYASTNPVGVISDIVLSMLNTNSHVYTVSPVLTIIEKEVSSKYARLFGFDGPKAGGLTFSGGSWSNVTSLQVARSILYPDTKLQGNYLKFAVFTSRHSHYSVEKAAILLGMGSKCLFKTKVKQDGTMDVEDLELQIELAKEQGYTPLYVNATAGTTVFGSYDPFEEISVVAKKHNIWFHIDGSWGGNAVFSSKYRYKLKGSELANSITTNPHKMLGVPTTCSFLLLPDERVFQTANSLAAPYLFHNSDAGDNYDLADGTMGCGRRADALKFYLGWLYYGYEGYEERVNHAFELANYFAKKINNLEGFDLVSELPTPCLQVCFYYNPKGKVTEDGEENTKITRFISHDLHNKGKFLVDFAPNPDNSKGEFFRVVFNSPIVNSDHVDGLIEEIISSGKQL